MVIFVPSVSQENGIRFSENQNYNEVCDTTLHCIASELFCYVLTFVTITLRLGRWQLVISIVGKVLLVEITNGIDTLGVQIESWFQHSYIDSWDIEMGSLWS